MTLFICLSDDIYVGSFLLSKAHIKKILEIFLNMYLNLKNKKTIFYFIIFFLIYLLLNFYKTNLVFAGKYYSKIQKQDSSENSSKNSSENVFLLEEQQEIDLLTSQVDDLYIQKHNILQEIKKIEAKLSYYFKLQNDKKNNNLKVYSDFLSSQICCFKEQKSDLKKKLHEISLKHIILEIKLKNTFSSHKK